LARAQSSTQLEMLLVDGPRHTAFALLGVLSHHEATGLFTAVLAL
jgi:hypothetical protein